MGGTGPAEKTETGNRKQETGNRKRSEKDAKCETGNQDDPGCPFLFLSVSGFRFPVSGSRLFLSYCLGCSSNSASMTSFCSCVVCSAPPPPPPPPPPSPPPPDGAAPLYI